MKTATVKEYAAALYLATLGLTAVELDSVLKNFIALLARQQKLKQADRIIAEFIRQAKRKDGIIEIAITSARQLTDATLAAITNIFGNQVEASERIDAALLGGMVVVSQDTIFDASLRTQLYRLKTSLM